MIRGTLNDTFLMPLFPPRDGSVCRYGAVTFKSPSGYSLNRKTPESAVFTRPCRRHNQHQT
ncbi:hypothetical protein CY34DRAFT_754267 [Suillus luteus UH-Slu-Lm8-n1]|uniref:Uncharacterized protein n=1 Tax=Suillus luteus UH-Slu-Lm8-n1 TaxID=930992 RepID=A0A0C9ZYC4_9AGAM|nr:hypothetical protein CY34DRAFT_754267 [Suillus luteus UH-Slu-Lm8-n1]